VAAGAVEAVTELCAPIELSTDQSTWKGQGDVGALRDYPGRYVHLWKRALSNQIRNHCSYRCSRGRRFRRCDRQSKSLPGSVCGYDLQAAVGSMQVVLRTLAEKGALDESQGLLASFAERRRLVNKEAFDAMEFRYVTEHVDAEQGLLEMPPRKSGRERKALTRKGFK
jgi:hypothetical protein